MEVEIVNLMAAGDLSTGIDLDQVSREIDCTEYEPDQFSGLIFRPPMSGTLTLFNSGKYSITGVTQKNAIRDIEDYLLDKLYGLGISLPNSSQATVRNIICTGDLEREIELPNLAVFLGVGDIEYEPEQSPFLVYRVEDCVMTIASTGKVVITGTTSLEKAEKVLLDLAQRIEKVDEIDDN